MQMPYAARLITPQATTIGQTFDILISELAKPSQPDSQKGVN
jgi:hypothetical protein